MPGLVLGDGRVNRDAASEMTKGRIRSRVSGRAVVRVDHVTRGASARPVVARMIVGPEERQQRIVQTGLLYVEPYGIDPIVGAEPASAQPVGRPPRILLLRRNPDFKGRGLATLEDPEDVPRLADLEPREGIQIREDALLLDLLRGRGRNGEDSPWQAVRGVA